MILLKLDLHTTGAHIVARLPSDPALVMAVSCLPGARYNQRLGAWLLPLCETSLRDVKQKFAAELSPKLLEWEHGASCAPGMGPKYPESPVVPRPYQRRAFDAAAANERWALFMDTGTGKTKVIVDLLAALGRGTFVDVVVCPLAVIAQWQAQIPLHQPALAPSVVVLQGGSREKSNRVAAIGKSYAIIIINYEAAWRIEPALMALNIRALVLDESTKIKNRSARQAKFLVKLSRRAERRYIMTGTPTPNTIFDMFNQAKFLDPTIFGPLFLPYQARYSVQVAPFKYKWTNLEEWQRVVRSFSTVVTKAEALPDLPPKIYQVRHVAMGPDQARVYRQMAKEFAAEIAGQRLTVTNILAKTVKLRQIAGGFVYRDAGVHRFTPNPKIEEVAEILRDEAAARKIVIWAQYTEEVAMLEQLLNREKLTYVSITGSTKDKGVWRRFQTENAIRVFVGNPHACGHGIELTAADLHIYYSNDYSYETRIQSEDRSHRDGQRNSVVYVDLEAAPVDAVMRRACADKAWLDRVVRGELVKELSRA